MDVGMTSITSEEAGIVLGEPSAFINRALGSYFSNMNYGQMDHVTFGIIAVDEDEQENLKFFPRNNKSGFFKHPLTKERLRYMSFSILFNPKHVEAWSEKECRENICNGVMERLKNPMQKIPKNFDYEKFVSDMEIALEIIKKAEIAAENP